VLAGRQHHTSRCGKWLLHIDAAVVRTASASLGFHNKLKQTARGLGAWATGSLRPFQQVIQASRCTPALKRGAPTRPWVPPCAAPRQAESAVLKSPLHPSKVETQQPRIRNSTPPLFKYLDCLSTSQNILSKYNYFCRSLLTMH